MKSAKTIRPMGKWISGAIVAVMVGLFGWVLLLGLGSGIARLSYDLPFAWRTGLRTDEVVIIYMDDVSSRDLGQPAGGAWDRRLHARLLERLKADGAKAAVFDVLFTAPSETNATGDHKWRGPFVRMAA